MTALFSWPPCWNTGDEVCEYIIWSTSGLVRRKHYKQYPDIVVIDNSAADDAWCQPQLFTEAYIVVSAEVIGGGKTYFLYGRQLQQVWAQDKKRFPDTHGWYNHGVDTDVGFCLFEYGHNNRGQARPLQSCT